LDYENSKHPYQERKVRIGGWKDYAIMDIQQSAELLETAKGLQKEGLPRIECLHIASAIAARCEYFLTTDERILARKDRVSAIKIEDPILFVKECEL
jgi:hypothetical protein